MVASCRRVAVSTVAGALTIQMLGSWQSTHCALPDPELQVPLNATIAPRAITARDLLTLREVGGTGGSGLSVSPDGRHVAFELHQADLQSNSYRAAWFVASTASRAVPRNVGDAGDPLLFRRADDGGYINGAWISEKAAWSPDGEWILYRRMAGDEIQLWRSRRDGGTGEQLTHSIADVERFRWSRDGSKILFAVDAPRAVKRAAALEEADEGFLFDGNTSWSTARGKPFDVRYSLIGGKPRIWVYECETGIEREANHEEAAKYLRPPAIDDTLFPATLDARVVSVRSDGAAKAWLSPAFADRQGLLPPLTLHASLLAAAREDIRCDAPECTGMIDSTSVLSGGLWWSPDGREIYFARKEGANHGLTAIYGWDPHRKSVRKIFASADWISDCARAGSKAICFKESPTKPRIVVAVDLTTGAIETLVDPNPDFDRLQLNKVARLEWADSGGRSTFGYLVTPGNAAPAERLPLILVGYRAKQSWRGGVGDEYPVQLLAANGFAVLVYDKPTPWELLARISDPSGAELRKHEESFELQVPLASIEAVIDHLNGRGLIDPRRVGITGLSSGASIAGYALVNSNRFAAAAVSYLTHNPISYFLTPGGAPWRSVLRAMGLGRQQALDDVAWKRISLALNADRVNAPLLINVSDDEYLEALQTVVVFSEERKPVEMHVYADEYHVKWQPRHRHSVYVRNVDWFNFWLRNYVDPDPDKAEQYSRWRSLKSMMASPLASEAITEPK